MWQLLIYAFSLYVHTTRGYPFFRDEIPNGYSVINPCNASEIWNGVGHENKAGGGLRNPFGLAFYGNGKVYNKTFCEMDSDGDGRTNGEELGDPDCTWTKGGTPSRTTNITHPGICEPLDSPTCHMKNTWLNCTRFNCPAFNDPATLKIDLKFPRTEVPAQETTYICMGFQLPSDKKYHMVGTQPQIDNVQFPHHMLVYGCKSSPSPAMMAGPQQCEMAVQGCLDLIGVWTVGLEGHCFPPEVGLAIGQGSFPFAVLQIHWNNPQLISGQYDATGIRLYYTDQLRPSEMIIIMMGQMYLDIPPGQARVEVTGTLDAGCTKYLNDTVLDIIAAGLHMHLTGRAGSVDLTHSGVTQSIISENNYDYNSPKIIEFHPYYKLQAGDSLKLTCVFDSTGRQNTTHWGEATRDEMCYVFVMVTPPIAGIMRSGQYKTSPVCPLSDAYTYYAAGCDALKLKQSFGAIGQTCNMSCPPQCMQSIKAMNDTNCFNVQIGGFIRDFWPRENAALKPALQVADYCTAAASLMTTPPPAGSTVDSGPWSSVHGGSTSGPGGPTAGPGGSSIGPGGQTGGPGGPTEGPGGPTGGPSGPGVGTTPSEGSEGGEGNNKKDYKAAIISSAVVGGIAVLSILLAACCLPGAQPKGSFLPRQ